MKISPENYLNKFSKSHLNDRNFLNFQHNFLADANTNI